MSKHVDKRPKKDNYGVAIKEKKGISQDRKLEDKVKCDCEKTVLEQMTIIKHRRCPKCLKLHKEKEDFDCRLLISFCSKCNRDTYDQREMVTGIVRCMACQHTKRIEDGNNRRIN